LIAEFGILSNLSQFVKELRSKWILWDYRWKSKPKKIHLHCYTRCTYYEGEGLI